MLIELGAASWGLVAVSALLGGGAGVCLRIPSSHSEGLLSDQYGQGDGRIHSLSLGEACFTHVKYAI